MKAGTDYVIYIDSYISTMPHSGKAPGLSWYLSDKNNCLETLITEARLAQQDEKHSLKVTLRITLRATQWYSENFAARG